MPSLLSNFTTTGPDGVTPGIATTEFWISAATWGLAVSDAFGFHHFTQAQDSLIIAGVPMLYLIVRSVVKAAAAAHPPVPKPFVPPAPGQLP